MTASVTRDGFSGDRSVRRPKPLNRGEASSLASRSCSLAPSAAASALPPSGDSSSSSPLPLLEEQLHTTEDKACPSLPQRSPSSVLGRWYTWVWSTEIQPVSQSVSQKIGDTITRQRERREDQLGIRVFPSTFFSVMVAVVVTALFLNQRTIINPSQ